MTVLKELKGMPSSNKALELLKRLMKHTAPIIGRYNWNLRELKEFYPKQGGLLGLNMNKSVICIRLRRSGNKEQFLDWHDILGTMIHELAHMKVSEHSAAFYDFMDSLYTEAEKDEDSGLIHRFDGSRGMAQSGIPSSGGKILGGNNTDSRMKSRREIAKERAIAAEKRKQVQSLMGSGTVGMELGTIARGLYNKPRFDTSTREGRRMAMAWAAERRFNDNIACPAESHQKVVRDSPQKDYNNVYSNDLNSAQEANLIDSKESTSNQDASSKPRGNIKRQRNPHPFSASNPDANPSPISKRNIKRAKKVIDLTEASPPKSRSVPPKAPMHIQSSTTSLNSPAAVANPVEAESTSMPELWSCPICTFRNPECGSTVPCGMCTFQRQEDVFPSIVGPGIMAMPDTEINLTVQGRRKGTSGEREEEGSKAFDPFQTQVSSGRHTWRGGHNF